MKYYYFIAGLPDIEIEDNKLTYSVASFKEELNLYLSKKDKKLISLYYTMFDNKNVLRYIINKETEFDTRGNISKEEFEVFHKQIYDEVTPKNRNIPPYVKTFLTEYKAIEQPNPEDTKWENRLTELYYQWAMKCGNKLISNWFEYNLNLNNILSAYISRKYKLEIEPVGSNEVAETIKTSKRQRDFGLSEIIEELDIFEFLDEEDFDLYEREKDIDLLKWKWLEEQTFFEYFNVEWLFAYLIKLEIIERWLSLNPEQGGKIFREMINNLKESVVNMKNQKY